MAGNQHAQQERLYQYTRDGAIKAAEADAAQGIPDSADRDALPPFPREILSIARDLQVDVLNDYSHEICPLDDEAKVLAKQLSAPAAKASKEWADKFMTMMHSPFWYWSVIVSLFAADLIVNSYVFQSQMANADAAIIAAVLALALFFFAKSGAVMLRQGPSMPSRVLGGILLLPPIIGMYIIAKMRIAVVASEGGNGSLAFFYGVNLLFFLTGVLLSFVFETKLERMERRLSTIEEKRQRLFEKYGVKAMNALNAGLWFIDTYRTHNDRAQGINCMWRTPVMPFPTALMKLHEPEAEAMNVTSLSLVDNVGGQLRQVGTVSVDDDSFIATSSGPSEEEPFEANTFTTADIVPMPVQPPVAPEPEAVTQEPATESVLPEAVGQSVGTEAATEAAPAGDAE